MNYIEKEPLLSDLKRYRDHRLNVCGDKHGASIATEAYKIAARQPIVVGEWEDDVCSVCLNKTKGAMEQHFEWCPRCGAEMKEVDDGNR